eukprot:EG_transcript_25814
MNNVEDPHLDPGEYAEVVQFGGDLIGRADSDPEDGEPAVPVQPNVADGAGVRSAPLAFPAGAVETAWLHCGLAAKHSPVRRCGPYTIRLEGCGYKSLTAVALATVSVLNQLTGEQMEMDEELSVDDMEHPEGLPWRRCAGLRLRVVSCNGEDEAVVQFQPPGT